MHSIELSEAASAMRTATSDSPAAGAYVASPRLLRWGTPQLTRDMPLYVVMNARSGSRDPDESKKTIAQVLDSREQRHEFVLIESTEEIGNVAKRVADLADRNQGAVAVAAGDGTINAVAQALMPARRPFGIIPKGTFNFMARDHGIPVDLEAATENLVTGIATPVQVGALNDRIFLVNASVGLHPKLLQDRENATRKFGRKQGVAFWSGIKTLFRKHREFVVKIAHDQQEEVIRTPSVFVGNNALQIARVDEELAEALDRWRLVAVIMRPVKSMSLLALALRGAVGKLGDDEHVISFDFRTLTVEPHVRSTRPIRVATDGELCWMKSPLRFSVAKDPLLLIKPQQDEAAKQ